MDLLGLIEIKMPGITNYSKLGDDIGCKKNA